MPMSAEYEELRRLVGNRRIFNPSVAAVIHNSDGEVLLVRGPSSALWSLPAGAMELGETPADAVVREVREETGLEVRPEALLGVFGGKDFRWEYADHNQVEYLIVVFWCAVLRGPIRPLDDEIAEFRWCSPAMMPALQFPYPPALLWPRSGQSAHFQPASNERP